MQAVHCQKRNWPGHGKSGGRGEGPLAVLYGKAWPGSVEWGIASRQEIVVIIKTKSSQVPVAHAYNPSYLGGSRFKANPGK
jgi:hypothetical protein